MVREILLYSEKRTKTKHYVEVQNKGAVWRVYLKQSDIL